MIKSNFSLTIQKFMDEHKEWADKTFGANRKPTAPLHHLKKEVEELIEAVDKSWGNLDIDLEKDTLMEFADCWILLHHAAAMYHLSAEELFNAAQEKFEIAKKRKWGKPDENGVVLHIKE